MSDPLIKFKLRKAWNEFGHSHYLTFSTYHKTPYLSDERICKLLAKSITKASHDHTFAILAYVFMPDHVHLLLHPIEETYDISKILKSIKQGPSRSAKNRNWIDTDLWEAGGGFDRNVMNQKARNHIVDYIHQNPVRKEMVEESWSYRWSSSNWRMTGVEGHIKCYYSHELWEQ